MIRGALEIIWEYRAAFLSGLLVTLELSLVIWTLGLLLGLPLGYLVNAHPRAARLPFAVLAFVLSGIPALVLLVWAHFPLQVLLGVVIDPFLTTCWVLSVINIVAVAQIFAHALREFPDGYFLAARVCGLSRRQTFWRIKIPIVLRQVLPSVVTTQVGMLQATLFGSLISVNELFRVSQRINATAYKPVEIYTALAALFLLACLPLNGLAIWYRNRFTKRVTEEY